MKKIFKLAAIAVSMALVTSLVACSSGDDDVVDATTPEYLLKDQIGKYVASIQYDQNVSDAEIKSFEKAHDAVMDMLGDCADCLEVYFDKVKEFDSRWYDAGNDNGWYYRTDLSSINIEKDIETLKYLKSYDKEDFHKVYVYKSAIDEALEDVDEVWKVYFIGVPSVNPVTDKNTILDGELNDRQAENMKAYTDAVAALKDVLSDDDKKLDSPVDKAIKNADKKIEDFNNLGKNKVTVEEIEKVTDAVEAMCADIEENVCAPIDELASKKWSDFYIK